MKRVFLRHEYRNRVIKLHNLIERLVTNRLLLKVSPLEARKSKNASISASVCHVTCGDMGSETIRRSVHRLLCTEIIHVFEMGAHHGVLGKISHGFL